MARKEPQRPKLEIWDVRLEDGCISKAHFVYGPCSIGAALLKRGSCLKLSSRRSSDIWQQYYLEAASPEEEAAARLTDVEVYGYAAVRKFELEADYNVVSK